MEGEEREVEEINTKGRKENKKRRIREKIKKGV